MFDSLLTPNLNLNLNCKYGFTTFNYKKFQICISRTQHCYHQWAKFPDPYFLRGIRPYPRNNFKITLSWMASFSIYNILCSDAGAFKHGFGIYGKSGKSRNESLCKNCQRCFGSLRLVGCFYVNNRWNFSFSSQNRQFILKINLATPVRYSNIQNTWTFP